MGINKLHFEGVQLNSLQTATCETAWFQHPWQEADRVSREDVALAIAEAESNIERELGYRLIPTWEQDEWRDAPRAWRPEAVILSQGDVRAYAPTVQTRWKHLISGGIRGSTVIDAAAAIVWSDADGDGYKETGTVTAVTTVTDPCEVHLFYPGKSGNTKWEIRPITVAIAAGTATITFRRELCVLESILESLANVDVPIADGLTDADFLATADVYRVYNDPSQQVQFLWEPFSDNCGCGSDGCTVCAYSSQYGCLHSRGDHRSGIVAYSPATWNTTTLSFDSVAWSVGRQPDITRLWYYAGLRDLDATCPTLEMTPAWQRTVAYYATALLDRETCSCNAARVAHWQADLAATGGAEELSTFTLGDSDLNNPFGTRRGEIYAWRHVRAQGVAAARSTVLV